MPIFDASRVSTFSDSSPDHGVGGGPDVLCTRSHPTDRKAGEGSRTPRRQASSKPRTRPARSVLECGARRRFVRFRRIAGVRFRADLTKAADTAALQKAAIAAPPALPLGRTTELWRSPWRAVTQARDRSRCLAPTEPHLYPQECDLNKFAANPRRGERRTVQPAKQAGMQDSPTGTVFLSPLWGSKAWVAPFPSDESLG